MPILRRDFLFGVMAVTLLLLAPGMALADNGHGGSGSSGDTGSSESGDDGDSDDGDKEDKGDNKGDSKKVDLDDVRDAVKSGEAMSLKKALKRAKEHTDGRIIDVNLVRKSNKFVYVFTVVEASGRLERLNMDAVSGRFTGLLGF
jgi:hypothetical protein